MSKQPIKPLEWVSSSKKDLLAMPDPVIDVVGYALHLAQNGLKHSHAKVLKGFGSAAVLEVVENDDGNTYRAVYTCASGTPFMFFTAFRRSRTKVSRRPSMK